MKIYCNVSNKYRKFENPRTSYIFLKTLGLSHVYSKWGCGYKKKHLKKKNQLKY